MDRGELMQFTLITDPLPSPSARGKREVDVDLSIAITRIRSLFYNFGLKDQNIVSVYCLCSPKVVQRQIIWKCSANT